VFDGVVQERAGFEAIVFIDIPACPVPLICFRESEVGQDIKDAKGEVKGIKTHEVIIDSFVFLRNKWKSSS
jgi:hypothetical protein